MDARVTGLAQARPGLERFLHHRAEQAGEFRWRATNECLAQIEVGEHAVPRVGQLLMGRLREQAAGDAVPVLHRSQRHRFLALEMVEKAALGHPRRRADIVDRGGGVTLGPDDLHGRIEQARAGVRRARGAGFRGDGRDLAHTIPTGWYGC
jgi:hypothetical protein